MFRNQSVSSHSFAMVPKSDIPRSKFLMQKAYKTTFDAGYLIPVFCEEILPGDSFNVKMTAFCRLATPIFPFMDNLYLDSFFFFVPNRLVWNNWQKFMGEQENPGDSISYLVPILDFATSAAFTSNSIFDYFGLPLAADFTGGVDPLISALPFRGYNLIYNQWFRDENLILSTGVLKTDGPDNTNTYVLKRRGKRHDYFTSCLPFLQKGTSVPIFTGLAPVFTSGVAQVIGAQAPLTFLDTTGAVPPNNQAGFGGGQLAVDGTAFGAVSGVYPSNLYASLSAATLNTINAFRVSFQIQMLLEKDARGGTRYTEIVRSHFGVVSPDARLQRPEYLGGGTNPVSLHPIAQTSETSGTPLGTLAAFGTSLSQQHGFSQSFTEHGYVIGMVSVRSDYTYQQGLRRHWSRRTRYDYYFPAFAQLGEQAVLNKEIYCDASATDAGVFGYQERWAEYRYNPSEITGLFRSSAAGTLDPWHLAQNFTSVPGLGDTFISEDPPLERVLALGSGEDGKQFLFDAVFNCKVARPMPLYSVPGLLTHL